jgi:hypothetical protein
MNSEILDFDEQDFKDLSKVFRVRSILGLYTKERNLNPIYNIKKEDDDYEDFDLYLCQVILLISCVLKYDLKLTLYISQLIDIAKRNYFDFCVATVPLSFYLEIYHSQFTVQNDEKMKLPLNLVNNYRAFGKEILEENKFLDNNRIILGIFWNEMQSGKLTEQSDYSDAIVFLETVTMKFFEKTILSKPE